MSNRILKINTLLKKELAELLLKELEFPKDILVTLTRVETTRDLKESKVYISVLPEEKGEKICQLLNRKIYWFQKKIDKRLKMKIIPKIEFFEEKKTGEAGRIEEILEELKKEEK